MSRAIVLAAATVSAGWVYPARSALGTTYTWVNSGVSNNWTELSNWTLADGSHLAPPLTPAAGDMTDLIFAGTFSANQTSTQNVGEIEINSMTFATTFSGTATLALSASSTGNQYIRLGAGGLVGNAGGTIALTGGTNRKLILTADQSWSNSNTAAIISQRRTMEGAFKITKTGAGTIEFQADDSAWTGGLQINDGWIRLSNFSNAIGAGTITNVSDSATGIAASGSTETIQNISGPVVLGGTGTFGLAGSWKINLQNTVTLQTDKIINVGNFSSLSSATDRQISGNIVGPGGLIKAGIGTMLLSGVNNTYAGNTTVLNGVLSVGSLGQLGGGTMITLGAVAPDAGTTSINSGTLLIATADQTTSRAFVTNLGGGNLDYAGALTINNTVTGTGPLTKVGAGNLTVNAVRIGGALTLNSGVTKIAPNGTSAGTSVVKGLNLAGGAVPTAALDLADNDLVVDYDGTSPLPTVTAQIIAGRTGPNGIMSSSATAEKMLGVGESSVVLGAGGGTFSGQSVDNTAVLVKYTYGGDANLDGQVDVTDLGSLATNWQTSSPWTGGDFNYDGFVDVTDLGVLATNWQKGVGAPLGPGSLQQALAAAGLGSVSVPEPAFGFASICIAAAAFSRRRRTRC